MRPQPNGAWGKTRATVITVKLLGIKDLSAGIAPKLIRDLLETIARLTGFEGRIVWDTNKPKRPV